MQLTRSNLQALSLEKKADARLLIENGRWSNAYYLYGYSIELALKACIARKFLAETIPDKKLMLQTYTHKIAELVALADLKTALAAKRQDEAFDGRWRFIEQWSEEARYAMYEEHEARAMQDAIEAEHVGVFQWIAGYWRRKTLPPGKTCWRRWMGMANGLMPPSGSMSPKTTCGS